MTSRLQLRKYRTFLGISLPIVAMAITHCSLSNRPKMRFLPPTAITTSRDTKHKLEEAIKRSSFKDQVIEDLLAGRITITEAFALFERQVRDDQILQVGLPADAAYRSITELSAISLIHYLYGLRDQPLAQEFLGEARCEFESRYGPQVWMLGPYGVVPNPVE